MDPYDAPRNEYDRFVAGIRPDDGEVTSMMKWHAYRQRQEEQRAPPRRPARSRRVEVIRDDRPATLRDALAGIVMIAAIAYGGYWLIARGTQEQPHYKLRSETQAELVHRCDAFARAMSSSDDKPRRDARDSCLGLGPLRKAVAGQ